jgi:hypothetical protein
MTVYALVAGKKPPVLQVAKEGEQSAFKPGDGGKMIFQMMPGGAG